MSKPENHFDPHPSNKINEYITIIIILMHKIILFKKILKYILKYYYIYYTKWNQEQLKVILLFYHSVQISPNLVHFLFHLPTPQTYYKNMKKKERIEVW